MKYLILVLITFTIGCAKGTSDTTSSSSGPPPLPFPYVDCAEWTSLRAPDWLILQLDMEAEMATDIHQCANGCGAAYYNGVLYQGCN